MSAGCLTEIRLTTRLNNNNCASQPALELLATLCEAPGKYAIQRDSAEGLPPAIVRKQGFLCLVTTRIFSYCFPYF